MHCHLVAGGRTHIEQARVDTNSYRCRVAPTPVIGTYDAHTNHTLPTATVIPDRCILTQDTTTAPSIRMNLMHLMHLNNIDRTRTDDF